MMFLLYKNGKIGNKSDMKSLKIFSRVKKNYVSTGKKPTNTGWSIDIGNRFHGIK